MKKKEFEDFCLKHAQWAREEMIHSEGSFRQQAVILDLRGRLHVVIFEEVLHGFRMRNTLQVMAMAAGGADAFLIMADSRFKMTTDENEMKRIQESAGRGQYMVADDESNPESLLTWGRSHEHTVFIFQKYKRELKPGGKGACRITFEDPAPKIMDDYNVETDMLPNPWERVH